MHTQRPMPRLHTTLRARDVVNSHELVVNPENSSHRQLRITPFHGNTTLKRAVIAKPFQVLLVQRRDRNGEEGLVWGKDTPYKLECSVNAINYGT